MAQISMENWSSSVFAAVEPTGFFVPESFGEVSSAFPRPEVMPGSINSLAFVNILLLIIPGMLGRFLGGVRARGEFLMLIRKFLSYLHIDIFSLC